MRAPIRAAPANAGAAPAVTIAANIGSQSASPQPASPRFRSLLQKNPFSHRISRSPTLQRSSDEGNSSSERVKVPIKTTKMEVAKLPDFSHLLPPDYRKGYLEWRKGNAKGSKGELSSSLDLPATSKPSRRSFRRRGSVVVDPDQDAKLSAAEIAFWGGGQRTPGSSAHGGKLPDQVTKQILIIYTGGTIGMVATEHGYDVKAGYLAEQLRLNPRFNSDDTPGKLVLARSPRGYRVEYSIHEYDPLLDSANITVKDWVRVARDIEAAYHLYDGFIVLHGTDTMAYTASALSFMMQHLSKPVILTGAQIPFSQLRNDSQDNLLEALITAADFCLPEVMIVFAHRILRGCRATKSSSNQLNAFDSPNCRPLGTVGITFDIEWDRVQRPPVDTTRQPFSVHSCMSEDVGILYLFPGIQAKTVKAFFSSGLRGVVIKSFGAGNFSQAEDVLSIFSAACQAGVCIINTTQCAVGGVAAATYAAGESLQRTGVISGLDMTSEASLTKLSFLIGSGLSVESVRDRMQQNLRGELSVVNHQFSLRAGNAFTPTDDSFLVGTIAKCMDLSTGTEARQALEALLPALLGMYAGRKDVNSLVQLLTTPQRANLVVDHQGQTALHVASRINAIEVMRLLIERGASLDARDVDGHTPLYMACVGDHREAVKLLLDSSAQLGLDESEAVHILCSLVKKRRLDHIETWVKAGIDVNAKNYDLRTPLHLAADEASSEVVELLVRFGAIQSPDRWGNVPTFPFDIRHS